MNNHPNDIIFFAIGILIGLGIAYWLISSGKIKI